VALMSIRFMMRFLYSFSLGRAGEQPLLPDRHAFDL
jgi:hypothetical protein